MLKAILISAEASAAIAACVVSAVAVIITVVFSCINIAKEKKKIILDKYESLYSDMFELRQNISLEIGYNWYYEISAIANNKDAVDAVTGAVNSICNIYVSFYKSRSAKRLWLKLLPPKLFERMLAVYPFIVYMRKHNNDPQMFQPYCEMIEYCCGKKKFKDRYFESDKAVWVGIRQSDIQYAGKTLKDCITVFGKSDDKVTRPNQNVGDCYSDLIDEIYSRVNAGNNESYIFYNPKLAYALNESVRSRVLGLNPQDMLALLNDKLRTRAHMATNNIQGVPSLEIYATDLNYKQLCKHFGTEKIVIQKSHGGGGYGTYLINSENSVAVIDKLKKEMTTFLISPYMENSVSVNVHIAVSDNQTVLFPASVQLVELHKDQIMYRGADFISFRDLPFDVQDSVQVTASKIADVLRKMNYRGVAGIDMLVCAGEVYFLEVNPRFQASSIIIDKYLNERQAAITQNKSERKKILAERMADNLAELHKNAFRGIINTDISFYDEINYACYYYYDDGHKDEDIIKKLELLKNADISVDTDGYCKDSKTDTYSYLYRAVFSDRISQISPDCTLWISDNIKIGTQPKDKLPLKIALLNQGVRIKGNVDFKKGTFDSVDFRLKNNAFPVNSPVHSKWVELSPFELSTDKDVNVLKFYGTHIDDVKIEHEKIDRTNESYNCLFLSTDRLRISPTAGCQYKRDGAGCLFCDVNRFVKEYTKNELENAAEYALKEINPRHIMIGGGTVKNLENLNAILDLTRFIKGKNPNMEITLMSVPPLEQDLNSVKQAGITDVSFNIEIFDEVLAKQLMPAKSDYTRQYYMDVLSAATKVWPTYGDVRSIVLVGLESTSSLLDGVKKLNDIGVQPVLSVFRPMKNSALYNRLPPSNEYLLEIHNQAKNLLAPTGSLGPKCTDCRNNTLSV